MTDTSSLLMGAILFLGLNAPTLMLMKLIPQGEGDELPRKLRALVWPFLICGWLVAAGGAAHRLDEVNIAPGASILAVILLTRR